MLLFHPLVLFLISNVTLAVTAAYTQRGSLLRYAALVCLAVCAYLLPQSLHEFARTTGWVGRVAAGAAFWNVVSCSDRLILRRWDYENYDGSHAGKDPGRNDKREKSDNSHYPSTRMGFGSEVSGAARGVGLPWEVKNVPRFSKTVPNFVPARGAFILVQIIAVVSCYCLHNFSVTTTLSLDPQFVDLKHIPLLTRGSDLSIQELKARTIAVIGYWAIQYSMMQFFYSAAGLISAVSNPHDIKSWRPLFGSPSDSYTLRNFWGSASSSTWSQSPQADIL